jgi:hypothetical protein
MSELELDWAAFSVVYDLLIWQRAFFLAVDMWEHHFVHL